MRARFSTAWLFFFLAASLLAQPCSPVRFRTAPEARFGMRSPRLTAAGLERRPDGSFTRREYHRVRSDLTRGSLEVGPTTDGFEGELYRCSGFPSVAHRTASFLPFAADRAGFQSSVYLMTDLSGDGRLWGVGIENRLARDAVIVVPATADFSPASDAATYTTGPNPRTVLAADFNNDGSRDLAVPFDGPFDRSTPGGVSVFLNNGDGTFAPGVMTLLGNFAFKAAAGDWNRDGVVDLAVSQSQPQSLVLLNGRGDGTFQAPVQLLEQAPAALISGDLTGDGRLDLITVMSSGFRYFPGTATGALGPAVEVDLGLTGSFSIELGDFDSDGRMDVAQGSLLGQSVSVALNEGADRFSAPMRYLAGRDPIDLHAMDFDGDGVLDVVIAGGHPARLGPNAEGGQIAVLRGRGDGSFTGAQVIGGDEPAGVAAADFDGDGADDVATTVRGAVEVWLSDGAGNFSTSVATAIAGGNRLGEIAAADPQPRWPAGCGRRRSKRARSCADRPRRRLVRPAVCPIGPERRQIRRDRRLRRQRPSGRGRGRAKRRCCVFVEC